jgi:hypothetical protein
LAIGSTKFRSIELAKRLTVGHSIFEAKLISINRAFVVA